MPLGGTSVRFRMRRMNPSQASRLRRETQMILAHNILDRSGPAYRGIRTLLFQAQHDLRMKMGLLSVAIPGGQPFDYFDEIRKITEMARDDLLFVASLLWTADFVSQYLPQIKSEVTATYIEETHVLLPAVQLLVEQSGQRKISMASRILALIGIVCSGNSRSLICSIALIFLLYRLSSSIVRFLPIAEQAGSRSNASILPRSKSVMSSQSGFLSIFVFM